jgi:hypothetical protein
MRGRPDRGYRGAGVLSAPPAPHEFPESPSAANRSYAKAALNKSPAQRVYFRQ